MTTCVTCGESDFHYMDGHYFCVHCQTQSQDFREEEAEDEYAAQSYSLRVPSSQQTGKSKEKKKYDYGRPWKTTEAFQFILKEQVKAFINMNAPKQFQDIVFRLWTLYLSKCGVAFTESNRNLTAEIQTRVRDKYLGTLENPKITPKHHQHRYHSQGMKAQKERIVEPELQETIQNEDFYDEDDPFAEQNEEELGDQDSSDSDDIPDPLDGLRGRYVDVVEETEGMEQVVQSKFVKYKCILKHRPEHMRLAKTITFCYLALLYCKCQVVASDFVRWIKTDKIPYLNVTKRFPKDFVLQRSDKMTFFCGHIPSSKKIRSDTGRVAVFLGLKNVPDVDIHLLISRYLLEMNLPAELHAMANRLYRNTPKEVSFRQKLETKRNFNTPSSVPNYEAAAMAYIVIILKLLFGLDDNTERELSKYARKLSDVLRPNQPLFIWEDWVHYMEKKSLLSQTAFKIPRTDRDVQAMSDVSGCLAHHNSIFQGERTTGKTYTSLRSLRPETRDALQMPFTILMERLNLKEPRPPPLNPPSTPTPAPTTTTTRHTAGETPNVTQTGVLRDFRGCSIKYLTEDDEFLEQLDKQGLSDYTISSSMEVDEDEDEEREEADEDTEEEEGSADDMFVSQQSRKRVRRKKKRLHRSSTKRQIQEAVLSAIGGTPIHRDKITKEEIQNLAQTLLRANERYVLYKDKSLSEANRHRAYKWLLDVCCQIIECDSQDLENEIRDLEVVYIVALEDLDKKSLMRRNRLLGQLKMRK